MLSNFLGRASVIHCKMRMFAFSLTTVKLFRHGNCFSGHRSHSLPKRNSREEWEKKRSQEQIYRCGQGT